MCDFCGILILFAKTEFINFLFSASFSCGLLSGCHGLVLSVYPLLWCSSCIAQFIFAIFHTLSQFISGISSFYTQHIFSYRPPSPHTPLTLLLFLSEFTSSGHCKPGVYVWNPRESVCGHGETTRWHAGDDSLQRKRQIAREAHKVPHHAGVYAFSNKSHSGREWVVETHKTKMAFWCCSVSLHASSAVIMNIYWTLHFCIF